MAQPLPGSVNSRTGEVPLKSCFRQAKAITKSIPDGGLGLTILQLMRVQQELNAL